MDVKKVWNVRVYEPAHASAANISRGAIGMWPTFTISEPTVAALKEKLDMDGYCSSDKYSVYVRNPDCTFKKTEHKLEHSEVYTTEPICVLIHYEAMWREFLGNVMFAMSRTLLPITCSKTKLKQL